MAEGSKVDRGSARWMPLCVLLGGLFICLLLYGRVLGQFFGIDDLDWLSGRVRGNPWRLVPLFLLRRVCRPLFGPHPLGYYVMVLLLHAAVTFLVYRLFVLLVTALGAWPRAQPRLLHTGGALAAFTFGLHGGGTPGWLSALPYLVATFLCLSALCLFLSSYLKGGRIRWWAGVVCFGLALFTHSFAWTLPAFLLLLECLLRSPHAGFPSREERYAPLAALLVGFGLLYGSELGSRSGVWSDPSRLVRMPVWFGGHLVLQLNQWVASAELSVEPLGVGAWLGLVACVALVVGAVFDYRRRGRPGGVGLGALTLVAWNALVFFQWVHAAEPFAAQGSYRLYFGQVGVSLGAGCLWMMVMARFAGALSVRGAAALLVGLPLVLLPGVGEVGDRLGAWTRLVTGPGEMSQRWPWGYVNRCPEVEVLTREEMAERAAGGRSLGCVAPASPGLSGMKLGSADLAGARLSETDLSGAILRGADLSQAWLVWAQLVEADLREADLTGACLSGADLSGADLRGIRPDGANLVGADLRGANLRGAELSGADLRQADLRGADLRHANLGRGDLDGVRIHGAQMDGLRGGASLLELLRLRR